MEGKYLNPKYARNKRYRRRLSMTVVAVTLCFCCLCALYTVDATVRTTMLPAAPPVAGLQRQQPDLYELTLFGETYQISTLWASRLGDQLQALLATPSAPVRLGYQLRAMLWGEVPRNLRTESKKSTEV